MCLVLHQLDTEVAVGNDCFWVLLAIAPECPSSGILGITTARVKPKVLTGAAIPLRRAAGTGSQLTSSRYCEKDK